MGGEEGYSEFDASTTTRILTPSENLLSNHEASMVKSKKRKRQRGTMEDLFDESFWVKPHPSTVFTKPHTLSPIALIPRTHVPLSFLDILSPSGPLPVSRLFEAHVKILELEERMGNTPVVLIACCDDGKSIYVVERVEQDLYVLCKLGSWVSLSRLCMGAIISRHETFKATDSRYETGSVLHENKVESQVMPESSKYSKKKRLAIEAIQSMVKRPSRDSLSNLQHQAVPHSQSGTVIESQPSKEIRTEVIQEGINIRPIATEIFDNIRSQYFEALYLSKASLAYFAKGPLSRARAAFHLDYDSTLDMNELIEFLEGLILPTTMVDKKYKYGVPSLLSIIMPDGSAEGNKTPPRVKKHKSKKLKPGKNGLYPAEDAYISRWWGSYDTDADKDALGGSKEDIIKKRVAQLRIREMQLQMIVILETLALQSLVTSPTDQSGKLPSNGQIDGTSDSKAAICSKTKKSLDLVALVEVNIDRLCIWQSLAAEDGRITSTLEAPSDIGSKLSGLASTHDHAADILREFCIEVIVPFFSARLPEQCSTISRKLGGPVVLSPAHPKLMTSASSPAVSSRPGGITKRPVSATARRNLRRVITDERHACEGSRGASSAISLMRSATAPAIPRLKRERSETPLLSSIPSAELQSMLVSRGGVLKSKKFSQREVDLSSLATVNDTKLKKASIEAELKDAITALKRPNRQLAGQLQVEAERRVASASMHSRKSKKPVRNPSFQGVEILSTPKGNRRKDMTVGKHPIVGLNVEQGHDLDVIPASSIPRMPLSREHAPNTRESGETLLCEATPARSGTKAISAICGTPSQGQTKSAWRLSDGFHGMSSHNHSRIPPCSPLQARQPGKQEFLEIPSSARAVECTPSKVVAVHATPSRQGKLKIVEADASSNSLSITIEGIGMDGAENTSRSCFQQDRDDDSIYKSLGWDYDELA